MRAIGRPAQIAFALMNAALTLNAVSIYLDRGWWFALAAALFTAAAAGSHTAIAIVAPLIRRAET